jgi:undecaprenyl-diphosphatase
MDLAIFHFLNGLAGHSADALIVFCAKYLAYVIGVAFVVMTVWPAPRWRMAIAGLVSAALAYGSKYLILLIYMRPRPFVTLAGVRQLVDARGEEYQSFPSGHALFFFALAMAVYRYDKKIGRWFFAGATVMSIARVAAGIHWPSDILAGALIGIAIAYGVTKKIHA